MTDFNRINQIAIDNDLPFAWEPEKIAQHEDDEIISVIINVPAPKNQGCDI